VGIVALYFADNIVKLDLNLSNIDYEYRVKMCFIGSFEDCNIYKPINCSIICGNHSEWANQYIII
jgi:hypothetical protein